MQKKTILAAAFGVLISFSVLAQLYLILVNRTTSVPETLIRFFSYFTILTNSLAAVYFILVLSRSRLVESAGVLTAITIYILIVGAVYQLLLRHIWSPTGLQKVVDELLHTINPVLVLVFWYLYEAKHQVRYKQIPRWLIYPLVYLCWILFRGQLSGFYPYPFVDANVLGLSRVLLNSALLLIVFVSLSFIMVKAGHLISNKTD